MSPERWQTIKEIFEYALELAPRHRAAFLAARCAGDPALRAEVEQLILQDEEAGEFLATGIVHPERLLDAGEPPQLAAGALLAGRFRIVRFLGRGGMGEVYEALDEAVAAPVALKTIRPDLAGAPAILQQFRSEVQLAREVTHPNVCRIHDLFDPGPSAVPALVFLTMEFVRGEVLARTLSREGILADDLALRLLRQISEGLAAAHAAGIVHRDLKSANIMLARDRSGEPRAVIMDFGIAAPAGDPVRPGLAGGTPAYMAPELLHGQPASPASDIFALGVVAHEMFTGMRPVPAGTPGAPDPLSLLPEPRRRAIRRCLDPDPAARFSTARDFAAALEDRPGRTRRQLLLGAGAVALLAGGAAIVGNRAGRKSAAPPQIAVIPFRPGAADPHVTALSESLSGELIRALAASPGFFAIGEDSTRALASLAPNAVSAHPPDDADDAADAVRRAIDTGKRLGVPYVLSGTVDASGGNIVVRPALRSTRDGAVLWTQVFAEDVRGLPRFRGNIAAGVASAVNATLGNWARTAFARPLTGNADAYQKYLLGRSLAVRRGPAELEGSLSLFAEALALDAAFAQAHAARAASLNILAGQSGHPLAATFEAARAAATHALELDPQTFEAYVVLASVHQRYDWNWTASDGRYRQALAASPGFAIAHQWYSGLLSIRRLPDDAVLEAARARELDPLALPANTAYGAMLYRARRYPDAIRQLEFTLGLAAEYQPALTALGIAYREAGRYAESLGCHERCVALSKRSPSALSWLGYAQAAAGQRAAALQILGELEQRWPAEQFSPSALAQVCQGLRDLDGAFKWWDLALQHRDPALTILRADPGNDLLRADPRYERILRQLDL